MKSVSIRDIRFERQGVPVVTLREDDAPRRQFDIFIGLPEAIAIKASLDGETTSRPLTHDLFVIALERIGVSIERVVVVDVREGTYFAEVVLAPGTGEPVVVSSRPSDALAIALRAHCPIYVSDELLDQVGEVHVEATDGGEAEILDEFKSFIENISPEDFES
jgi:hypothetical protein